MHRLLLPSFLSLIFIINSFNSLAQSWTPVGPDDFNQLSYGNVSNINHDVDNNGIVYAVYKSTNGLLVKRLNGITWEIVGTGVIGDRYAVSTTLAFDRSTNTPYLSYVRDAFPYESVVKKFNGTIWEDVGTPGFTNSETQQLILVFNGTTPYVVYKDVANGTDGSSVMKFNGTTWEQVGGRQFSNGRVNWLTMAFDGNTPYVAFEDIKDRYDADDITTMKFNGITWEKVGTSITALNATEPSIAIDNTGVPYVSFMHFKDIKKRSKLYKFTGGEWETVGTQGFGTDERVWGARIAFDNNILYGAFVNYARKVIVNKLVGTSWYTVDAGQFSGEDIAYNQTSDVTNLTFHNNQPYVSYKDATFNAVVKKFNGINWEPVGSEELTASPSDVRLAANAGVPYIVYTDTKNENKTVVRKFNGNNWEAISDFQNKDRYTFDIAFNSSGYPGIIDREAIGTRKSSSAKVYNGTNWLGLGEFYGGTDIMYGALAYNNEAPNVPHVMYINQYVYVKKFVNGAWAEIGKLGGPGLYVGYVSFAIHNNVPYVAYGDPTVGRKLTVTKFNGTGWEIIGSAGFSTHTTGPISLAFTSQGVPQVAFANDQMGINMMQFDGTNWVDLAPTIPTNGSIPFLSMIIHNDIPFLAYADNQNGDKAAVKWLNGSTWENIGTETPSQTNADRVQLAADGSKLFMAYSNWSGTFIKKFELNTLPVKLTAFTAKAQDQKVQLQWQTASETNSKEFIVTHTTDGKSFKELTRMPSKGNANTLTSYAYAHQNPFSGTNYYQLLQVDIDGKTTNHGTRTVNFDLENQSSVVYPNPTTDEVNIAAGNAGLQKIQLVDLNGQTLKTILVKPNQSIVTISLVNYPSGVYLIKIIGDKGTATHKIIKQ